MEPRATLLRMHHGKTKRVGFGPVDYSEERERFLKVELDLAITFCQTGLAMLNRTRAELSAKNARKALDTVERMFPTMILTEVTQKEISEKIVLATWLFSK